MDNRNPIFIFVYYICTIILCLWGITGFRTAPITDQSILEHQARIAELERRVVDYERRISEYDKLVGGTLERLETIRGRADRITDRLDRIIFLFDEYEREINRLNNAYNKARGTE